jgi:glycosyltransferase involved in cell wall biosynthesis
MIKVLWVCPNLNHYKYKYLNYLNTFSNIEVTILSGSGSKKDGHIDPLKNLPIKIIPLKVSKQNFGFSKIVNATIKKIVHSYDYIMLPRERKNIFLIIYTYHLLKNRSTKMFSYNHPVSFSGKRYNVIDIFFTRFLHKFYDKIIFYTKASYKLALDLKIIPHDRAFFANNTVFTKEIEEIYKFKTPSRDKINFLFIGRLVKDKNLKVLFDYYLKIKSILERSGVSIELTIIGDGPEKDLVLKYANDKDNIHWAGPIIKESEIMKYMLDANFIFNPGHSGLHINHALAYGRPYITIFRYNHAPEIDYIKDGYNGFILDGEKDIERLVDICLENNFKELCHNSYESGKELSIDNWCNQIIKALN